MTAPPSDCSLTFIGTATTLLRFGPFTVDARQGADLLEFLRPHRAIPVHNDDYGVFKSPLSAFLDEAAERGVAELVRVVPPGQTAGLFD